MGKTGIGHICAAYRKQNKALPHLTAMLARLADESIHCSNCRCDYELNEDNFGEWHTAREIITSNALPRSAVDRITVNLATVPKHVIPYDSNDHARGVKWKTKHRSDNVQISSKMFESLHDLARNTISENGTALCLKEIATLGAEVNVWEYDDSVLILCLTKVPITGTNVVTQSDLNICPRTAIINPHAGVTLQATGGYVVVFSSKIPLTLKGNDLGCLPPSRCGSSPSSVCAS